MQLWELGEKTDAGIEQNPLSFQNTRYFAADTSQKEMNQMKIEWVDGFEIRTRVENGTVIISANKEGMLSLAKQLAALADSAPGEHIHYDEYSSLESGSAELILERVQ